jgi:hypothetical protein
VLRNRVPIVTTTEEAAYGSPAEPEPREAGWLSAPRARTQGGGPGEPGVNPQGSWMDALPIALTAVCERVDSI